LELRAIHRFPAHHVPFIRVMSTDRIMGFYGPDEAESYTFLQAIPLTIANGSASAYTVTGRVLIGQATTVYM
jgi:hypothetical protein